jgi:hypothetical protein
MPKLWVIRELNVFPGAGVELFDALSVEDKAARSLVPNIDCMAVKSY